MCGIIGYSGHRPAVPLLMDGLRRLEYRGYDSSGVAFAQAGSLHVVKAVGKQAKLEEKLESEPGFLATAGIAHTRWATHGVPAERNAHPHLVGDGELAVVHNGIIENYQEIKAELLVKGVSFQSETDTEVLAWLIAEETKNAPSVLEAFARALRRAHGAYAVVMISRKEPHCLYAARMDAPLLLGPGAGECFLGSDIPAFLPYTRQVVFLENGEISRIEGQSWQVLTLADLAPISKEVSHVPWDMQSAQKGGHKHFMLKEIMEQPQVVTDCLGGRLERGRVALPDLDPLPVPERLRIVACGTSYNAGLWCRGLMENVAGIPTEVEIASEFRYRDPLLTPGDTVLVISQSGETLDSLSALRLAKEKGCRTLGLCNVLGSSISREADAVLYTQAGPEISVASTKAMCSQMLVLTLMAAYYANRQGKAVDPSLLQALPELSATLERTLPGMRETAKRLARKYAAARSFFYLGRDQAYPLALEGALKLKELAYIHAEGYAAGEMKHGPIALIDPDFPTFALALDNCLLPKVKSNIVEIKARQGKVVALVQAGADNGAAFEDWDVDDLWPLPPSHPLLAGLLALPALQLFSYEMADYLGKDVDQPRNLAKSVTVE